MGSSDQDPHDPVRHSPKMNISLAVVLGILGGIALCGGTLWYFTWEAKKPAPAMPGAPLHSAESAVILESPAVEITPLAELHLKVVKGVAESVEAPQDSGLTAKIDNKEITVTAAKDAKAGIHQIKIHSPKGRESILTVTVKRPK